jgi:hypothetical protein
MSKTSRVKLRMLPELTRKTLPKVRFRPVAAVQKTDTGTWVTFADGKKARVGRRSPLAALSVQDFKALSNSLPQLLAGALQAASASDLVAQGSFSSRFTDHAISINPALQGLIAGGCEVPRLHEHFTRWLETQRIDYTVELSFESLLDVADAAFHDLRLMLDLQMNGIILVTADLDKDGEDEAYYVDHNGDVVDIHMNPKGNIKDAAWEQLKTEKGCGERFWDWFTGKDGIMWGKEFPIQLQTFVVARFIDMHSPTLRTLVTDVAAGQLTVAALAVQANALLDLKALKAAFLGSSASPAVKLALGPDLSVLQAVHLSAVMAS